MAAVIIGMDPHKLSATIEVVDDRERVLGGGRFSTDREGFAAMLAAGRAWPQRTWAVEGCNGIGRHIAQRLIAAGEPVVDVPAKLSARARVFSTGQGRKTDATDAHSVAIVGVRTPGLRQVEADGEIVALRLLADRRSELASARTQAANRVHRLLLELIPAGAPRFLSAAQAKALLATVRPRDVAGKTRRAMAAELISEIVALDKKIRDNHKQLDIALDATGTTLRDVYGLGPVGAARVLGDVGDVRRFASKAHFASWNGTAPIDASSGENNRHRLSRSGNRRINAVLHIMAMVQIRNDTPGRAYYLGKIAKGKTRKEARRCLKRRLSDVLYRQLLADAERADAAAAAQSPAQEASDEALGVDPGGQVGATTTSSAAGNYPITGSSEKPLPGATTTILNPTPRRRKTPALT